MFHSSARFARSVGRSHDVLTVCNVIDDSGSNSIGTLDVIAGHTTYDSSQTVRSSCTLTLQDPTGLMVPNTAKDILQPYSGYTLQLERGISWRDGTKETFPLGTFWPYNPRVNDTD